MKAALEHPIDWLRSLRVGVRRAAGRRRRASVGPMVSHRTFGEPGFETFFGYYDVTPVDRTGRYLLCGRRPQSHGPRAAGTPLALGLYDLSQPEPQFRAFAETRLWCWQQGCRLQWLPEDRVIYNAEVDGRQGAEIRTIGQDALEARLRWPVYAVHPSGQSALTLNFARLQALRPGYGYDILENPGMDVPAPEDDGIWLVDFHTNERRLIFSLADAARLEAHPSARGAIHYFNHLCWNPSGTRFLVFHIWQGPDGRSGRAVTLDAEGGRSYLVTNETHVSHYWWLDDETILLYSTHRASGERFHLYRDGSGVTGILGESTLAGDGHPSRQPGGAWLVGDTLVNRRGERDLYLFHLEREQLVAVGSFYSPPSFAGEHRCDLHPRWSPDARHVVIDSAHLGRRTIGVLDVSALI